MRLGSTIKGSSAIQISIADEDVLLDQGSFYKFSMMNEEDAIVSINGSEPIFLKGGMGFSTSRIDAEIYSFIFLEEGISYFWIGGE